MSARVFVVQDRESACFLCPLNGDVGLTPWINEAGQFESEEEALDTASVVCSEGFVLFAFYSACLH
jgi:hypothetical protein